MTSPRITARQEPLASARASWHRAGSLFALYIVLLALVYAPLAYGCTTESSRQFLDYALYLAVFVFFAHCLLMRRKARIPGALWKVSAGLLALGWLMALNSKYRFEADTWTFVKTEAAMGFLPGSIDGDASLTAMLHITALLAALLVLCHLCRSRNHRWLLLKFISASGAIIALTGLYLKTSGSDQMLWTDKSYSEQMFFSSFRYHGHAAAFLNLAWPASLAVLLRSLEKEDNYLERAVWINAFCFTVIAVFANTSQAGHLLVILGLVASALLFRERIRRYLGSRIPFWGALILVISVGVIPMLPSLSTSIAHWSAFSEDGIGSMAGRLSAYQAGYHMGQDSPAFGMGPGTFSLGFPYYTSGLEKPIPGFWDHLHQDLLQTFIEWGFVGGVAWLFIFSGALIRGVRYLRSKTKDGQRTKQDLSTRAALLALSIVCIHAMIDFPLQIASIQLLAVVYLAILWREVSPQNKNIAEEEHR